MWFWIYIHDEEHQMKIFTTSYMKLMLIYFSICFLLSAISMFFRDFYRFKRIFVRINSIRNLQPVERYYSYSHDNKVESNVTLSLIIKLATTAMCNRSLNHQFLSAPSSNLAEFTTLKSSYFWCFERRRSSKPSHPSNCQKNTLYYVFPNQEHEVCFDNSEEKNTNLAKDIHCDFCVMKIQCWELEARLEDWRREGF